MKAPTRWLIYALIGLGFGLLDWYFLDLLARLSQSGILDQVPEYIQMLLVIPIIAANYGVWLIPVIPTAIYEMKRSQSLWRAALSAIVVWSMALVSYYAYYTMMLMFVGLPNMDFMLFSNRASPTYWADWWPPFRRVILNQLLEWIGVAFVGGALVGALSGTVFDWLVKRRARKTVAG